MRRADGATYAAKRTGKAKKPTGRHEFPPIKPLFPPMDFHTSRGKPWVKFLENWVET